MTSSPDRQPGDLPPAPGRERSGGRRFRLALLAAMLLGSAAAGSSLSERLTDEYLSGLRKGARPWRKQAMPADHSGRYEDVRCVFHAHSHLSHDSRGTEEEIVAAARQAGVRAVFMTEHPTPDRKWLTEGMRGEKDGVLFVPGAELSDGLLIWRGERAAWTPEMKAGEVLDRLKGTDGVAFIAHPEKRKDEADWDLPPFAGMEIYNSHADAEDSGYTELLESLRRGGALKMLSLINTIKKFPQEAYAAIFDEQVAVLHRWDTLNERFLSGKRRVVGLAANDSHQNTGISFEATEDGLDVKDALGDVVASIPKQKLPLLLLGPLTPGKTILAQTFDPYEVSFHYVSTHVLAERVTEKALFDATLKGRAYVAFDWIADPSGFRFQAVRAGKNSGTPVEMGGDISVKDRPQLSAQADAPCQMRLLRNGQEVARTEDGQLSFEAREPGVYRVEAWVRLGEEMRPWVYTNPIYVVPSR